MSAMVRLRSTLTSFLSLLLLLTCVANVRASSTYQVEVRVQQNPRAIPPTQYIPDREFDTRHIALDLRFNWDREQLLARETLVFAPLVTNLKTLKLDAANIT